MAHQAGQIATVAVEFRAQCSFGSLNIATEFIGVKHRLSPTHLHRFNVDRAPLQGQVGDGLLWPRAARLAINPIMLNVIRHDGPADATPLVIAHGLFGSGRNWGVIAKRLAAERQVIAVDMRNHGASFKDPAHGYPEMAADLAEVIATEGRACHLLGHSMGGKAAMALALSDPEKLVKLVVADIAPVSYRHSQQEFIDAMREVDLDNLTRRSDAEEQLAKAGVDKALQSFFTQSLDVQAKEWRLNLDVLEAEMAKILSFPEDLTGPFNGPTLFLTGAESHYVKPEYRERIKQLFPEAKFAKIPGAGHWLHAEKPREFEAAVAQFLSF